MGHTPEIAALIKEADTDGDGNINFQEFQACAPPAMKYCGCIRLAAALRAVQR